MIACLIAIKTFLMERIAFLNKTNMFLQEIVFLFKTTVFLINSTGVLMKMIFCLNWEMIVFIFKLEAFLVTRKVFYEKMTAFLNKMTIFSKEMIALVILFAILNRPHPHIIKCEILFIFKKNISDKNSKSDKRMLLLFRYSHFRSQIIKVFWEIFLGNERFFEIFLTNPRKKNRQLNLLISPRKKILEISRYLR